MSSLKRYRVVIEFDENAIKTDGPIVPSKLGDVIDSDYVEVKSVICVFELGDCGIKDCRGYTKQINHSYCRKCKERLQNRDD